MLLKQKSDPESEYYKILRKAGRTKVNGNDSKTGSVVEEDGLIGSDHNGETNSENRNLSY